MHPHKEIMLGWLVLLCAAASAASQSAESRVVYTNHGPIRGYKDADGSMYSFYDVPYATVPTGRDKFKAPLPPPVWTRPFEAVYRGIACPQIQIMGLMKTMQEDCLVAHIFVPDTSNTNLPVAISVHGGAFVHGFGDNDLSKIFVRNNDMILVSFNYRLGAYGFLCLGTENVPGNAGMKDQAALLRWVNQNIAYFGGNPNDVTVMGCSAGGISSDLLTISNMTKNLVHKAIPESGCSFGAIGLQYDPIQNAKDYARRLHFHNVDDIEALEEFYITASPAALATELMSTTNHLDSSLTFAPCVERDVGVEMFLQEDPAETLKKGDFPAVPLLYGLAKDEGMFRIPNIITWMSRMNLNFSNFLPGELEFESQEQKESVARTVREFYFQDRPVGIQTMLEYIDYHTDVLFGFRMMKGFALRLGAKQQPIYLFKFSFADENTSNIPFTNTTGNGHCEQQIMLLDGTTTGKTEAYINMANMTRSMWTNFIFTGKPVPEGSPLPRWPTANVNRSPYMDLGSVVQLQNNMFGARFDLWNGIYERHYRKPKRPDPHPVVPDSSASVVSNTILISFLVTCSLVIRFY